MGHSRARNSQLRLGVPAASRLPVIRPPAAAATSRIAFAPFSAAVHCARSDCACSAPFARATECHWRRCCSAAGRRPHAFAAALISASRSRLRCPAPLSIRSCAPPPPAVRAERSVAVGTAAALLTGAHFCGGGKKRRWRQPTAAKRPSLASSNCILCTQQPLLGEFCACLPPSDQVSRVCLCFCARVCLSPRRRQQQRRPRRRRQR